MYSYLNQAQDYQKYIRPYRKCEYARIIEHEIANANMAHICILALRTPYSMAGGFVWSTDTPKRPKTSTLVQSSG
jgi:hypothetical protein